jgi:MFS family permease
VTSYSSAKARGFSRIGAAWSGLDSDLKRLILTGFTEVIAVNLYASVLMPYYRSLGFGSQTAGVLTSVLQVVGAVVAVFAGLMADSVGRKKMYVAGQLLRCTAAGLLLLTRSYAGLILVSVIRGLAIIQSPAQSAIFAAYTRKENRGTMLGLYQTFSQLASVLGPLAAGVIADRFGVTRSFGAGLILACAAVALAVPLKERAAAAEPEHPAAGAPPAPQPVGELAPREPLLGRVARMFKENRPVVLSSLLAASVVNGLGNGAAGILVPFTIMDRFSSAYTTVSASASVAALGTMLVLLIGGRIADVRGRRGLILVSGSILPLLMLSILLATSLWQLFALIIFLTMIGNIASPAMSAVNVEAVSERDRATFAGFQMGLNSAGVALGSVCAGIGYRLSSNWSWVAVIVVFALQPPLYAIALPKGTNEQTS